MIETFIIATLGFWGIACTLGFGLMMMDKIPSRSSSPKFF